MPFVWKIFSRKWKMNFQLVKLGLCLFWKVKVVHVKTAVKRLTLEIIQQVCNKIKSDQSVPAEVQRACESVDKQELLQGKQFLNGSLVSKRCFPTSDKERALRNFYTTVADDTTMRQISQTLPSHAGMYLCLEIFELLLGTFEKPSRKLGLQSKMQRETLCFTLEVRCCRDSNSGHTV